MVAAAMMGPSLLVASTVDGTLSVAQPTNTTKPAWCETLNSTALAASLARPPAPAETCREEELRRLRAVAGSQ